MIPHHLTLRNFLSYREAAELDLRGLHLACIAGLNGAGKSTILDGITWALFGKSRVKSDDDVVNRIAGPNGGIAEVTFTFELEGAIYRIIRRKQLGKVGELEFHARVPGEDRWQVRTEARIRETQAEIEKLLRMNYDVFTNASFLLQGKADEFTNKTADRRKEILAEILGVGLWDEYRERATEGRKGAEQELAALDRRLAEVEAELERAAEYTRELEVAEARAASAAAERDRQALLVEKARQNKNLADQYRSAVRQMTAELAELESDLQRVEGQAAQRRGEIAGYQALLDRRGAILSAYAAWQAAESEQAAWQAKAEQHAALAAEVGPLETAIATARAALEQRLSELEGQQARLAAARAQRAELEAQLAAARQQRDALQTRAGELADQEREWRDARTEIEKGEMERQFLTTELAQLTARAEDIARKEVAQEQIDTSKRVSFQALEAARAALAQLEEGRQQLADKNAATANLRTEQERLRVEMDSVKADLDKLQAGTSQDCPTCGQPLTTEHRETAIAELKARGAALGDRFRSNRSLEAQMATEIEELKAALRRQPALEKERDQQQSAVGRYESQLHTIENTLAEWREGSAAARLVELKAKLEQRTQLDELQQKVERLKSAAGESRQMTNQLAELERRITRDETQSEAIEQQEAEWAAVGQPALAETRRRLTEEEYAPAERAALTDLLARRAAVAYDPAAHSATRARLAELSGAPAEQQQLLVAETAIKPLADTLADLESQRDRGVARAADLRTRREQSATALRDLEAGLGDLQAAEAELQRLIEAAVVAERQVGGARQKVDVLAARRKDRAEITTHKTAVAHRASLLRQLEEACGRKGVQTLLIDQALPEIEEYANRLLERLTGGEMRISFDTTRPKKTNQEEVIETLDIKISDLTGERPYENYIGGEKFRVNFAIRLALSQLLARRAGARLQTLVIDEGFGSQDPAGRQGLVEAINMVQDEFACILVITHIEELRDKFPARIDVEKRLDGSALSVATI